jgi:hypothetical protein
LGEPSVSKSSKSDHQDHPPVAQMFNDEDFIPLPIPPGPNDAPLLTVSPPTPITAVTPKRPTPTDDDSSTEHRLLLNNDSPTLGRLSRDKQKALTEGFVALDQLAKEIAEASGLSVAQIVERWNGGTLRSRNSWNIYQSYFKKNLDQEVKRLITYKRSQSL